MQVRLLTSLREFSMSLMSTSFMICLSVLLVIEVSASMDNNDVELSSLSCLSTEIPALGVATSSAVCLLSPSIFIGVHFRLVELARADDGAVSSGGVSDFDVRTLLKGAGKDANFCARILTGKFHRAPNTTSLHTLLLRLHTAPHGP